MANSTDNNLLESLALLSHSASAKRRSGAKRLRKLKNPSAGEALLSSLQKEIKDPRTWETQYQMIMALGECNYTPALSFLNQLAREKFQATALYAALGDSIVRLSRKFENDPEPVLEIMKSENDMLIDGAFRAVAMMRLNLDDNAVKQIIQFVSRRSSNDWLLFWVVAAAPGWSGETVKQFVQYCSQSSRDDIRKAALAAQQGKYLKWNPL